MGRLKRGSLLVTLAVIVAAVGGAASSCGRHEAPSMTKVTLRLAWVPDMAEAGVFVAKHKGIFARHGLDVEIRSGGFGLDPLKLVAAGTDTFGVGGAGNLLLARERGLPVVAIAAEFQKTPVGFITKADSGITSFVGFRGKRVGIQTGADTDVLYRTLLAKFKMSSSDVSEVPIQYDMTPFVSGSIDVLPGYVTNQPITLRAKGFSVNVITAASQGVTYYGNVFFTTKDTVDRNPQVVREFVAAVSEGWEAALRSKEDSIAALTGFTPDFKPAEMSDIYEAVCPFIRPDEVGVPLLGMTEQRWVSTYDALKSANLAKASLVVRDAFTEKFIQR
jgi:NitT/TauT family transport system substrate-binding protein